MSEATAIAPEAPAWQVSDEPVPYAAAVAEMERHVAAMARGEVGERIWLLEHPALYTAGTSARDEDLFNPHGFPTFRAGRGGQWTYHGPGQRIGYVMLDLRRRGQDVRAYVAGLEAWMIAALDRLGIRAGTREGRVGLWVPDRRAPPGRDLKIGAIGVRVTRWITWHGFALNVDPNLDHFEGIVPCGVREHGVTSLWAEGITATMPEVDAALMAAFDERFGSGGLRP
ncbi:MAG: lipoyl(octanoyl) transferase LipB [Acetobacteraceae bacterium]|jgi:lipoyl(octanoyl) transferase|nr:lipoyl(octanoyl) transferase LipB [Acetobacteraceae bacterium]